MPEPTQTSDRLPCQVCGRPLVPLRDGTARSHGRRRYGGGHCQGSGYRLRRWEVGQRLVHHTSGVWVVVEDRGGEYGVYVIRCKRDQRNGETGREMVVHGEYMHRHGWWPEEAVARV